MMPNQDGRLLFRRQFILASRSAAPAPGWQEVTLRPSLVLTAHPDLPVRRLTADGGSITLLGYILDPRHPDANDEEILSDLLRHLQTPASWEGVVRRTFDFGGRWILIVDGGEWIRLFSDPCGYRQAFFARDHSRAVWCASQPGLLAEALTLEPSAAAADFYTEFGEKGGPGWPTHQPWWPADTSPYDEIRRVLPNHFLDLLTGEVRRFWPSEALTPLTFEDALHRNTELLVGMVRSAARRSPLSQSLTAGGDTRLLLAATRGIREHVFYFTLAYGWQTQPTADLAIARRVARTLRLPHHVIACPPAMDPWFERLYFRNVVSAHEVYGAIAQGLYAHHPSDRLCMKGNAMHITGGYMHFRSTHVPAGGRLDPAILLRFGKVLDHPFARAAVGRWLEEADASAHNVDLLNLFIWENKEGSWQAMSQLEWDIAQEVLVPYNCRSFLMNGLAIDPQLRTAPEYRFRTALTRMLWKEALIVPVNPPWPTSPLRLTAREWLSRMGLLEHARRARKALSPAHGGRGAH